MRKSLDALIDYLVLNLYRDRFKSRGRYKYYYVLVIDEDRNRLIDFDYESYRQRESLLKKYSDKYMDHLVVHGELDYSNILSKTITIIKRRNDERHKRFERDTHYY